MTGFTPGLATSFTLVATITFRVNSSTNVAIVVRDPQCSLY
jgi:hypothetical protein